VLAALLTKLSSIAGYIGTFSQGRIQKGVLGVNPPFWEFQTPPPSSFEKFLDTPLLFPIS